MVKGGLVGQLKKGFKKIVLVTSTMMFLNSLLGCPTPLPINNPPKVELNLDYTSGSAPLEIRIQVDGTDLDGKEDIIQYKLSIGDEVISQTTPIDITRTFYGVGNVIVSGQCTDSYREKDEDSIVVNVTEPTTPYLVLEKINDVDIKYNVILPNINEVLLKIKRNNELIETKVINSDYTTTLKNMLKGSYTFDLESTNGDKIYTDEILIPNYAPEIDLSFINTELNEEKELIINLTEPSDKNPEDNQFPIHYISANSFDGKVSIDNSLLNQNKIIIAGNKDKIGEYQIDLSFGNQETGIGNATLEGTINNLLDISGQLQDNETDSPRAGIIKVYDSSDNRFLKQAQIDSSGNFDFQLDEAVSEIILQARIMNGAVEKSYVRTIKGLSGLEDYILGNIRAVPYDGLTGMGITKAQFKTHMMQVMRPINSSDFNPEMYKWDFKEFSSQYPLTEVIISKKHYDPNIEGTFTDTEINNIKSRILDINDINSFFEGKITPEQISVVDNYVSGNSGGKIFLFPAKNTSGYANVFDENGDGYIDSVRLTVGVPLAGEGLDSSILAHEFGHGSGFLGHSELSKTTTIMNEIGSGRIISSGPIDKKASKIIYEDTYKGLEKLNDLMGDDFY
ncbi:hypothetical protein KAR52_02415 [Candidatus Pacearchaeota archaeon]|nr:hypothetical protein [Candidatus Pacearchaeota archaeon]